MENQAGHVLDLRGVPIPWVLLNIMRHVRKMNPNDSVKILVVDPDTKNDVLMILPVGLCETVEAVQDSSGRLEFAIRLKKKGPP